MLNNQRNAYMGGTERVTAFLANGLNKRGYSVTVITLSLGIPYYSISSNVNLTTFGAERNNLMKLIKVAKYLKINDFDTVIPISMGRLSVEISLIFYIFKIKSTLMLSEHVSYEILSGPIKFLKYFAYSIADKIIILTKHDKNILASKFHNKLTVIPNCSNFTHLSSNEAFNNKENIVLAVGRLNQQKAFFRLIKIWSRVEKNGWKLRIIGDGKDLYIQHIIIL